MLDVKNTRQSHPSLLPLRMVLTAAESETPPRPPCISPDEQRALHLIKRMKLEYDKPLPFALLRSSKFPPSNVIRFRAKLREVTGCHV